VLGLVHADETGGLSGKPLFKMSTDVLRDMYQLTRVSLSCCFFLLRNCNGKESQIM
jgi:dihydroorotate dehydrogenase